MCVASPNVSALADAPTRRQAILPLWDDLAERRRVEDASILVQRVRPRTMQGLKGKTVQGYYGGGGYPLGGLTLPGGGRVTLEQLRQELKPITERLDRLEAGQ